MQFIDPHRCTSAPELAQIARLVAVAVLEHHFG